MFDNPPKQQQQKPSTYNPPKAPPKGLFDEGNSVLDESISLPPQNTSKAQPSSLFDDPNESMVMEKKVEPPKPRPSTGQDKMAEMMRAASQKKNVEEKAFGDSSDDEPAKVEPKKEEVKSPVEA